MSKSDRLKLKLKLKCNGYSVNPILCQIINTHNRKSTSRSDRSVRNAYRE